MAELSETLSFDLQFGTIKFLRGSSSSVAVVNVEVSVEDTTLLLDPGVKISMSLKFAADPSKETLFEIVEKARRNLNDKLRTVAGIIETKSTETLLYGEELVFPLGNSNDPVDQQVY